MRPTMPRLQPRQTKPPPLDRRSELDTKVEVEVVVNNDDDAVEALGGRGKPRDLAWVVAELARSSRITGIDTAVDSVFGDGTDIEIVGPELSTSSSPGKFIVGKLETFDFCGLEDPDRLGDETTLITGA